MNIEIPPEIPEDKRQDYLAAAKHKDEFVLHMLLEKYPVWENNAEKKKELDEKMTEIRQACLMTAEEFFEIEKMGKFAAMMGAAAGRRTWKIFMDAFAKNEPAGHGGPDIGKRSKTKRALAADKPAMAGEIAEAMPMVLKMSHGRSRSPEHFDELVAVGNLALCRAAAKFSAGRGAKFSTYAYWKVLGAMCDQARDHRRRGQVSGGRGGEPKTISAYNPRDLDAMPLSPANHDIMPAFWRCIEQALAKLTPREAAIIRHYYFPDGHGSIGDLPEKLGITESRISQLRAASLKKLRRLLPDEDVEFFGMD